MADIDIKTALKEAEALVATLKALDGPPTPFEHQNLLHHTNQIRTALETPFDLVQRLSGNFAIGAAIYNLLSIGALQSLPIDGSSITAADLAAASSVNVSAITRMMRLLVVIGITNETAPDVYSHNSLSRNFLPKTMGAFHIISTSLVKVWLDLPRYFKSHSADELHDPKKTPFAFEAHQEGLTCYEVIDQDEEWRDMFNRCLAQVGDSRPLIGMFPFQEMKDQVQREPESVFFVDVAGGLGQAAKAVKKACEGGWGARMIIQDLPIVIETLEEKELQGIEPMVHDIFTLQPIKSWVSPLLPTNLLRK
jgi:hypothetical protein